MARDLSPEPGMLLIAPPMMQDPNFRRTVVFLCEHAADGSFGLILNRPLDIPLTEVLKGIGNADLSLQQGGPVQTDTLHFLHSCGDLVPGTIPITDDVYWGGDFDILKILIESGELSHSDVRFFLGYAGWSPQQLDEEVEQGGWILTSGREDVVFDGEPSDLWRKILRKMGGEFAVLANFPEDPRLN